MSDKIWRWRTQYLGEKLYFAFSNALENMYQSKQCSAAEAEELKPLIDDVVLRAPKAIVVN